MSNHKKEAVKLQSLTGVKPELPHLHHAHHRGKAGQAIHGQLRVESHLNCRMMPAVFFLRDEHEEEDEGNNGDDKNNNSKEEANASPTTVHAVPE